jgi:hypothetical protein
MVAMDSQTRTITQTLRLVAARQVQLWDRVLGDLQPWQQEGPLRWTRQGHLDGSVFPDGSVLPDVPG